MHNIFMNKKSKLYLILKIKLILNLLTEFKQAIYKIYNHPGELQMRLFPPPVLGKIGIQEIPRFSLYRVSDINSQWRLSENAKNTHNYY